MQEHFQVFGRYNAWANQRLYAAVERLPADEISKKRDSAYFGSILGTLNHILVGDRIWMSRFEGSDHGIDSLDQELYDDLKSLSIARREEDRRIISFVDRMRTENYAQSLRFRNMKGEANAGTYGQLFTHLFNHQTHHRGQVHALLKDAGEEPPAIDFIYFVS
ncbi:MAG: DinB family protein [Kiloniellales bacterium]|nr:DinB family protein [Kiloniellales bacterium]